MKKTDGSLIWKSQRDEAGYSSAVLQEVGGVRQAVYFTGERALGIDVASGQLLWSYAKVSNNTANIATPIVHGNRVFGAAKIAGTQTSNVNRLNIPASVAAATRGKIDNSTPIPQAICPMPVR